MLPSTGNYAVISEVTSGSLTNQYQRMVIPVTAMYAAVIHRTGYPPAVTRYPTLPSWGRIIADGRSDIRNAWWISTIPGIFLFFTVLAFNFLGDTLRDALDPRHSIK